MQDLPPPAGSPSGAGTPVLDFAGKTPTDGMVISTKDLTPKALSTDDFTDAGTASIMAQIQLLRQQRQSDLDSLLKSLQPTAAEKKVQDNLLGLQQDLKGMVETVQERPLDATMLTAGKAQEIANLTNGDTRQSLVNIRAQQNATEDLALKQSQRQAQIDAYKIKLDQGNVDITDMMQMQQLVNQNAQLYLQSTQAMSTQGRDTLGLILDKFKGLTFDQLDAESIAGLASIAKQAGIPLDVIKQGMKTTHDLMYTTGGSEQLKAQHDFMSEYNANELVQQYMTSEAAYRRIASFFQGGATKESVNKIAGNGFAVNAIIDSYARLYRPDISRAADAGSDADSKALTGMATQFLKNITSDSGDILPEKLLDLVNNANGLYKNALNLKSSADNMFKSLYGNSVQIPSYDMMNGGGTSQSGVSNYTRASLNELPGNQVRDPMAIGAAIKQKESGGNYNAVGGSGEFGAYQFMPATWQQYAQLYLGNPSAPMTQENQDTVAMKRIVDLVNKGYSAADIALTWNHGSPEVVAGVNQYGQRYDSGKYAADVLQLLASR